MRASRVLATVSLCLFGAVSVSGQNGPTRQPSVQAEVETEYTLPDGTQRRSKGRFYRNQFGQVREDSGLGAVITDLRAGTVTLLIAETKEAHVIRIPASERTPAEANRPAHELFEETTIAGRRTRKARTTGPNGQRVEFWTAEDLGIVTLTKSESGGMTAVRELKNISTLEPEPELFMIPADYRLIELKRPSPGAGPKIPPPPGAGPERGRGPGGIQ